ncbi:NAD(P)/FAD-dependent oxidoreductase [Streptomyces sp. NPDC058287]|uniref:NAD(P)/FAD-dependent oxidoreductase n=1 Tax=Streptomyces sp. NPDC058287 TaxID=3346423 RepID=UPI0036E35D65
MVRTDEQTDVVVVGAGIAGLACAADLQAAGLRVQVLEASDGVGGRMRSDHVDGFVIDRGFQVFNTAYPQVQRRLRLRDLRLRPFTPGVQVHTDTGNIALYDPVRRPDALGGLCRQSVMSARDTLTLGAMSARDMLLPASMLKHRGERTTRSALRRAGISEAFTENVLRPFVSGIFLEDELETSSRVFHLVWRSMLRGTLCLPADGIEAVPRMLADSLNDATVRLETPVAQLTDCGVMTAPGTSVAARAVVVAAGPQTAAALLPHMDVPDYRSVTTYYHTMAPSPLNEPVLLVDAQRRFLNTCVISEVVPSYAPAHRALVATSVLGTEGPGREASTRQTLSDVYATDTSAWDLVAVRSITHALPVMTPPHSLSRSSRADSGRYVCGDHRTTGSVQGAMASGARAAREVVQDLAQPAAGVSQHASVATSR